MLLNKNILAIGIILLLIGVSVIPSISGKSLKIEEETAIQVEPRLILLSKLYGVDTYASHFNPDENYGSSENIRIANEYGADGSSGWEDIAYIMFGLDWLTPYDNIAYAKLSFYYNDYENTDPSGRDLNIYRVTDFWDYSILTWNNQPAYNSTPISNATVPSSVGNWITWDVTSDVKDFVENIPSDSHYGYRIADDNYWGEPDIPTTMVKSSENEKEIRPYLLIGIQVSRPRNTAQTNRILPVTMPRNKATYNSLFLRFLEQFPILKLLLLQR